MRWAIIILILIPSSSFCYILEGDADKTGRVDGLDLFIVCRAMHSSSGTIFWDERADIDFSGFIDEHDLELVRKNFSRMPPTKGAEYVEGEVIVKFKESMSLQSLSIFENNYGLSLIKKSSESEHLLFRIDCGLSVDDMVEKLNENPSVAYAEPNFIVRACYSPNDPYFDYQWNLKLIQSHLAWDINMGDPDVIIAILDTGIAYEDYAGFCRATDLEEDIFVPGYDFINNDSHPNDDNGHGTFVCGVISQTINNSFGSCGVAPKCSIMPVKILDRDGSGNQFNLADGIRFAARNGAKVINMSLGAPVGSYVEEEAINYAFEQGAFLCAASGNDGLNRNYYPAAYPRVCAVGAIKYNKKRASYSNYGAYLDLMAPGGAESYYEDLNKDGHPDLILSQGFTARNYCTFRFYWINGTSVACPHVAAVAGLIFSYKVATHPQDVFDVLTSQAEDINEEGYDIETGYGMVNAYLSLSYAHPIGWDQ